MTKRPAARPDDTELAPWQAVLLILAVAYGCFLGLLVIATGALIVAGSVGLVVLFVGLAAMWLELSRRD